MTYKILDKINSPDDLRVIPKSDMSKLADEIRAFLVDITNKNGGHLASNLGTVELTLALHRVYDTSRDRLIFDVGHQCYTHKIITGRREAFRKNRMKDGISGFPRMAESEYDAFGAGHASVSISAALGMAVAAKKLGDDRRRVVAIIGDGAMSGGLAFEVPGDDPNSPDLQKEFNAVILYHHPMLSAAIPRRHDFSAQKRYARLFRPSTTTRRNRRCPRRERNDRRNSL